MYFMKNTRLATSVRYSLVLLTAAQFDWMKCDRADIIFHENESYDRSILNTLPRYVLYDVNSPEGFNLRRDVFIRMASFMNHLNKVSDHNWILVLPPWHRLYHWRSSNLEQDHIPWNTFFDVDSINKVTPVIELHEFLDINGLRSLDVQVTLQDFNLKSNEQYLDFSDKWEITSCKGLVQTEFWNLNNLTFTESICISFQGVSTQLADIIDKLQPRTIIFDHAEMTLHNYYGGKEYWTVRKSMKFNNNLYAIAMKFKKQKLKNDYMCAHLRRRDFLYGHPNDVPSIKEAAKQIIEKLNVLKNLDIVYIATDAPGMEFEELSMYLQPYQVFKYEPDKKTIITYMDGGIAIIDQIICSQANYFIGTSKSTYSFRIQEEREILGFPVETTFNSFCGNNDKECTQPSKWRLVE